MSVFIITLFFSFSRKVKQRGKCFKQRLLNLFYEIILEIKKTKISSGKLTYHITTVFSFHTCCPQIFKILTIFSYSYTYTTHTIYQYYNATFIL